MELLEEETVGGQVMGRRVSLRELNQNAITKLNDLIESLEARSEPDLIRACIESLAKLNSSIKNSDILEKEESEEERAMRAKSNLVGDLLKKG